MATEVLMPKLGLTMTEGTIGQWKKQEGDQVKKGDIIFSVETDKLTNDVEADTDGVLLKILTLEGETVPCKSIVAYIGQAGEQLSQESPKASTVEVGAEPKQNTGNAVQERLTAQNTAQILATPYAKKLAKNKGYDLANISGSGFGGAIVARDVESYVPERRVKLSPMAKKLAAELNIDEKTLDGLDRIMKADILERVSHKEEPQKVYTKLQTPDQNEEDEKSVRVSTLRRSIAANMSLSWATSPRVTYTRPVDVSEMKRMRARLQETMEREGVKLTYNHIIMLVVSRVLKEFPDINASFADNMLTRHQHVNLGLAVARKDGLLVPNLKRCEMLSLIEIARGTQRMIEAARDGKLSEEDIRGGTFTISSLGPYGITSFSPIINQPELAILGVCDMVDTPVVRNGEVVIRPIMNLSLTADHRVIDGVMVASFLKRVAQVLEDPYILFV